MSGADHSAARADRGRRTARHSAPLTPAEFRNAAGVSRETLTRLELYAATLVRWNTRINLVARGSLADLWRRHFLDSAQLLALAPAAAKLWVDLGSGAGFPGMVLAIMGVPDMHLIESDHRKCEFLRRVAHDTATEVTIHAARIEALAPFLADVITARALAPLPRLLSLARRFAGPDTVALFPKGARVGAELTESSKYPRMRLERVASRSDPAGTILRVKGLDDI